MTCNYPKLQRYNHGATRVIGQGSTLKIEHFLPWNRMERRKVTLRYIIQFRTQWKRSGAAFHALRYRYS